MGRSVYRAYPRSKDLLVVFMKTKIKDAYVIEHEKRYDERGFFIRTWCKKEFEAQGLVSQFVQFNTSFSKKKGMLRGLHYQVSPHQEAKLIRCVKGAIFDVMIDLRKKSPTYMQWDGLELRADTYKMVYIPEGVAHGFQTLEDETEIFYPVSDLYSPDLERGIRWNDPAFNIKWPEVPNRVLSEKDKNWSDYLA